MTELNDAPAREHLLLTVLGKDPKSAHYTLEDREAKAQLAPIALFDLLPEDERPDQVLALCTPEARQDSWPLLPQVREKWHGTQTSMFAVTTNATRAEPPPLDTECQSTWQSRKAELARWPESSGDPTTGKEGAK